MEIFSQCNERDKRDGIVWEKEEEERGREKKRAGCCELKNDGNKG